MPGPAALLAALPTMGTILKWLGLAGAGYAGFKGGDALWKSLGLDPGFNLQEEAIRTDKYQKYQGRVARGLLAAAERSKQSKSARQTEKTLGPNDLMLILSLLGGGTSATPTDQIDQGPMTMEALPGTPEQMDMMTPDAGIMPSQLINRLSGSLTNMAPARQGLYTRIWDRQGRPPIR